MQIHHGEPTPGIRSEVIDQARCTSLCIYCRSCIRVDRQTQFKALNPTDPYDHEARMKEALIHWLGKPIGTVRLFVAVEQSTHTIIGRVMWSCCGFNSAQGDAQLTREIKEPIISPISTATSSAVKLARIRLEEYTSNEMSTRMKRLMPLSTKCMCTRSIVAALSFRAKAIGSILVTQDTQCAYREGVLCWVHASEPAADMFLSRGFQKVGRLELSLDSWYTEGIAPPDSLKWEAHIS